MLLAEANWISKVVGEIDLHDCHRPFRVLNLGSSTSEFRTKVQPYIDSIALESFRIRNCEVLNVDLKIDDGVDIVADLLSREGFERLKSHDVDLVLCSNLLEHVQDPRLMACRLAALVREGAYLLVTVPCSFPYHADPIDNGFRPTTDELASLFPSCDLISGEEVYDTTYFGSLSAKPKVIPRRIARTLMPWPNFRGWLSAIDSLRWSFNRFSATCLLLQKQRDDN